MPYTTLSEINENGETYDFIVVGAGSAGCPLASRLSEDRSVTVLLIEAGPQSHAFEPTLNSIIPAGVGKLQHTTMDWQYYTEPQAPRACTHLNTYAEANPSLKHRSYWPRGKGVGGSSLINYMAWVRGHPNDYNEWETKYGAKGWSWKSSIEKLFEERIENTSECDQTRLCPKRRTSPTGVYGISHKSPVNELANQFLDACQELGFEHGDYNSGSSKASKGVAGLHQQSVRQGTRCSSSRAYIEPIMLDNSSKQRPNLTILTGAKCFKVLTATKEDGTVVATGVQLVPDDVNNDPTSSSGSVDIKCEKEVILSAGALGSPQILLQSGIGPGGKVLDSPQVGQNLQDHFVDFIRFQPKSGNPRDEIGALNQDKAEGTTSKMLGNMWQCFMNHNGWFTSTAYDASLFFSSKPVTGLAALMKARPNLQISSLCAPANKELLQDNMGLDLDSFDVSEEIFAPTAQALVFCCTLLHPVSTGSVTLKDGDTDELVIEPNYLDKQEDVKDMVACLRKALEIANTKTFQNVIKGAPIWPKDLCRKYNLPCHDDDKVPAVEDYPDEFLAEHIRRYGSTLYHPACTCRMGTDPKQAVVDPTLKVFGVKSLRIADASIQPTLVSANTQASCVVIGERAADIIREEYNLQSNPQDLLEAVAEYEAGIQRKRWQKVLGGVAASGLVAVAAVAGVVMTRGAFIGR